MTVVMTVVSAARRRLNKNERTNGPLFMNLTYHCSDKPSGGKTRKRPALRLATTTITIGAMRRSEEHTSELQSRLHLVCRLLLEKKKKKKNTTTSESTSRQD